MKYRIALAAVPEENLIKPDRVVPAPFVYPGSRHFTWSSYVWLILLLTLACGRLSTQAGPYAPSLGTTTNTYDAPIAGWVGPDGEGNALIQSGVTMVEDPDTGELILVPVYINTRNYVNPIFRAWATTVVDYSPAPNVIGYGNANKALGPVTGDYSDVVSLGDLSTAQILAGVQPGSITLGFEQSIINGEGADFVVFENGFISTGAQGVAGQTFAELAYVEVSTDGVNFARFPSKSLTQALVGANGTVDPTDVYNLAGKGVNNDGDCWGTPFDLSALANHPLVLSGQVNLNEINFVRVVDIPGNGTYTDSDGAPIYDAWLTTGSGGFDLEAIGAIHTVTATPNLNSWRQQYFGSTLNSGDAADSANPSKDGVPNLLKFATGQDPTTSDKMPGAMTLSGGNIVFTYPRNKSAVGEVTFTVEWSDDLSAWSTDSVTGTLVVDQGATENVSVTIPKSSGARRFVRLKVSR